MRSLTPAFVCLLAMTPMMGCSLGSDDGKTPQPVKRYAMVIDLKPERVEDYKKLHAAPWPGVLAQLERSNVHDFSIHLVEMRPGEYTLFGYFEYTGDDFEADMAAMAADPETQRWWKETGPCQMAIPSARNTLGEDAQWVFLQEIFYHP